MVRSLCITVLLALCLPSAVMAADAGHNGKVCTPLSAWVSLPYSGVVDEVLVAPGSLVKKGQPLARYRLSGEAAAEISDFLAIRQKGLQTRFRIAQVEGEALSLRDQHRAAQRLSSAHMGSGDALRSLEQSLDRLREQKKALASLAASEEENFRSRLAAVEEKLGASAPDGVIPEFGVLASPMDGEVQIIYTPLRKGQTISDPVPFAVLVAQTNPMEILVHVFETEVAGLRAGGKAAARIPALEDRRYDAVIHSVERSPVEFHMDKPSYYRVLLSVTNDDGGLRHGYQALVNFTAADK